MLQGVSAVPPAGERRPGGGAPGGRGLLRGVPVLLELARGAGVVVPGVGPAAVPEAPSSTAPGAPSAKHRE